MLPSSDDKLKTPDFARLEMRMTNKAGLKNIADELRALARELDKIAGGSLPDPTSNYLAWGTIKSTSQKLRSQHAF